MAPKHAELKLPSTFQAINSQLSQNESQRWDALSPHHPPPTSDGSEAIFLRFPTVVK